MEIKIIVVRQKNSVFPTQANDFIEKVFETKHTKIVHYLAVFVIILEPNYIGNKIEDGVVENFQQTIRVVLILNLNSSILFRIADTEIVEANINVVQANAPLLCVSKEN